MDAGNLVGIFVLSVPVLSVGCIVIGRILENKKRKQEEIYNEQYQLLLEWGEERYGPDPMGILRDLKGYHTFERMQGSQWAQAVIDGDKRSRVKQATPFVEWGEEHFGVLWQEECKKLCRLVSSNRTQSIDMLSDMEIGKLNETALRDYQPIREAKNRSCKNCGAPLVKSSCSYCGF